MSLRVLNLSMGSTLLDKAKLHTQIRSTKEERELAVAWVKGEIPMDAVVVAHAGKEGLKQRSLMYYRISKWVRDAVKLGEIEIVCLPRP